MRMRRLARRSLFRVLASSLASSAVLGGMLVSAASASAATSHPAAALQPAATTVTSCQVTYTVSSDWGTGFTAAVTIQNTGSAITSWTLGYSYAGNQALSQGWSGTWAQTGKAITVTSASWNGSLATGASAQIGANFTYSGTNTAPTAFTLNGTACNGGTGSTPTPTPTTSPSSSPTPTPTPSPTSTASGPAPQLHVSGNKLVNASGQQVVLHGWIWQVVTYSFIHAGFWHWFGNMIGIWMFGSAFEGSWGTRRFLELYSFGVVGAAITTIALSFAHALGRPDSVTVGASGGVFAILIAFGMVFGENEILMIPFPISLKAKYFVAILIVVTLAFAIQGGGNVAYVAHLGGLFFGYVYVKFLARKGLLRLAFQSAFMACAMATTAGRDGAQPGSSKSICASTTAP